MNQPLHITSRDNQHLKFARRVRDRKEPDYIFIEGKRLCREAVVSGVAIEYMFVSDRFNAAEFDAFTNKENVRVFVVADSLIASIADTDSPQGIVMVARRTSVITVVELFEDPDLKSLPVWICLEGPTNPSNLGAVIRTAEAAGAPGVIITAGSVDPLAPKTLRASMGSAFRVPIALAANTAEIVDAARAKGLTVAGMDASGERDYLELDWTKPTLLVVGSETDGLSKEATDHADQIVRIGMKKPVESLNLAVSTGIVLFEAARQFRLADR